MFVSTKPMLDLCQRMRFLWHFCFIIESIASGSLSDYNLLNVEFLWQKRQLGP